MDARCAFVLRRATDADAADVTAVHLAARAAVMPHLPRLHSDAEILAYFRGLIAGEHWDVRVAEAAGRVVAFSARIDEHLDHLYVLPACQRRGIGRALLEQARRASGGALRLYCFQCNAGARAFYEAVGFAAEAFSDGAGNPEREPDILYRWPAGLPA